MISREEYERLLGAIDALKQSMIPVTNVLPDGTGNGIASEIDAYGANANLASRADEQAESLPQWEAQRDTAWDIAAKI